MESAIMDRVTAHLSKLRSMKSTKDDDMIFLKKVVVPAKEEYAAVLLSFDEENIVTFNKLEDLSSKLDEVNSEYCNKAQLLEELKTNNNELKTTFEAIDSEHKKRKLKLNELSKTRILLEDRIKRSSHNKLNSADIALFNDRRLRTSAFKNVLGIKFDFNGIDQVVEGYVFNKNYTKWFTYRLDEYSKKEISKFIWKEIKKCANIKDWPVPSKAGKDT